MSASHLEFLVEEPSMEAFLRAWLPRVLSGGRTFEVRVFQGKTDLLGKLEARLRAYAAWMPDDWRIVVVVDRDDDDCRALKRQLEEAAERAGLVSRSRAGSRPWQVVNRIAIVGDVEAGCVSRWCPVDLRHVVADRSRLPATCGSRARSGKRVQGGRPGIGGPGRGKPTPRNRV